MLEYRDVYAGGRLVGSGSADVITIVNPATEEVTGAVPSMVERDVEVAVNAARRAFDTGGWPLLRPAERAAALDRLAAALEARAEDTARLVTAEMGMPITLSRRSNVSVPCAIIRYYAALARELTAEEVREAISFTGRTVVRREPAGVAAVIASWSYPLILAFCQLAPALAAGCTVVLLPAPETSLSAYILAEAFEAAEFPPGVFNLVTGTAEVGEMLAAHPGVDTVAVAGPTPAGRRIAAICGQTLKPVTLELGGKSAAIVLDDVDLDAAAAELGSLCFANSGQACFTMSRVLAPRSRYDEAVWALAAQASSVVVGDPLAEETTMGPLANPRQRASVESCVTAGVAAGAHVVVGGRAGHAGARLLLRAHRVRRGDGRDGHRPGRDLRPGGERDRVRRRVRGGGDRQRLQLRAGRERVDRRPRARPDDRAARTGRDVRGEPVRTRYRGAVGRPQGEWHGQHLRAGGPRRLPGHQVRVPARGLSQPT